MIKVVIDTNVVVSANLVDEGPSAAILSLAIQKQIQMFVSPAVLAEYEEVLHRPRLKFDPARIKDFLARVQSTADLVHPNTTLAISSHPSDNRFYECAAEASADYLVTGNTKHFPKQFENISIVTPRQFLEFIVPHLAHG